MFNYNKITKILIIPFIFNDELVDLPNDIEIIIFWDYFNQNVDNLPLNLTHLIFRFSFNQSIINMPKCIQYLSFPSTNPIKFNILISDTEVDIKFYEIN